MEIKYSHSDVALYALNYAIDKMHGGIEIFKDYFEHVQDLRNVKTFYSKEPIYTYEELDRICTKYGEDSMLDFNLVFDKWYKIYLRYYKIMKIKNGYR